MKNNSYHNFGKFERNGSTYTWNIVFDNGKIRSGHTKPQGQSEPFANDKFQLLKNRLTCLWNKNGYRNKCQYLTVYRCLTDDDKDNIELFTLFTNEYRLSAALKAKRDTDTHELREFLNSLYENTSEKYRIKDKENVIELGIASAPGASSLPTKQAKQNQNFDYFAKEAKTKIFASWKSFDSYIDSLPKFLSEKEKQSIITSIWENPANQKWTKK